MQAPNPIIVPPGELPPQFPVSAQGRFLATGIYYEVYGQGQAMVLLHGVAVGPQIWVDIIEKMANAYTLVVPELRGHGRSQRASLPISIAQMAADVWDILDAEGIESAYIIGHSMGGAVAQAMARQHPRRLTGLVLASTFAYKQIALWERIFPYVSVPAIRLWGVQRFAELNGVFGTGGKRVDGPFINLIKRVFRTHANESMVAVSKAIFAFDSRPWLHELEGPVLLLFGDKDTVMPPHHGFIIKGLLPKAALFFCGNCGHAMFHTHTAWMVEKMEAYISQNHAQHSGVYKAS